MLERHMHGESWRACVYERGCVGAREKNRKSSRRGTEQAVARPEPERVKEEAESDEIVREFLLESSTELEQAGEQPGGSGPGDRGKQFCAGAGGEPGDVECDGARAGVADAVGFSEVNSKHNFPKD